MPSLRRTRSIGIALQLPVLHPKIPKHNNKGPMNRFCEARALPGIIWLRNDPLCIGLIHDVRYQAILKRLNLAST